LRFQNIFATQPKNNDEKVEKLKKTIKILRDKNET